MAFKTVSRNQQRWASNVDRSSSSGGKKKKQPISPWVRSWLRKEDRKKRAELRNPSLIDSAQKALKVLDNTKKVKKKKLVRLYVNIVVCMLVYSEEIPLPPKKLKSRIGAVGPEDWVKGFVNWPDAFVHFQKEKNYGLSSGKAHLYPHQFITEQKYKNAVRKYKCRVIEARIKRRKIPKPPPILRNLLSETDIWHWVSHGEDFDILLEQVKQRIAERTELKKLKK